MFDFIKNLFGKKCSICRKIKWSARKASTYNHNAPLGKKMEPICQNCLWKDVAEFCR